MVANYAQAWTSGIATGIALREAADRHQAIIDERNRREQAKAVGPQLAEELSKIGELDDAKTKVDEANIRIMEARKSRLDPESPSFLSEKQKLDDEILLVKTNAPNRLRENFEAQRNIINKYALQYGDNEFLKPALDHYSNSILQEAQLFGQMAQNETNNWFNREKMKSDDIAQSSLERYREEQLAQDDKQHIESTSGWAPDPRNPGEYVRSPAGIQADAAAAGEARLAKEGRKGDSPRTQFEFAKELLLAGSTPEEAAIESGASITVVRNAAKAIEEEKAKLPEEARAQLSGPASEKAASVVKLMNETDDNGKPTGAAKEAFLEAKRTLGWDDEEINEATDKELEEALGDALFGQGSESLAKRTGKKYNAPKSELQSEIRTKVQEKVEKKDKATEGVYKKMQAKRAELVEDIKKTIIEAGEKGVYRRPANARGDNLSELIHRYNDAVGDYNSRFSELGKLEKETIESLIKEAKNKIKEEAFGK